MSGSTDGQTANQAYFDAALRHAVDIRRYTAGEVRRILQILEKADMELVHQLRDRLGRLGLPAARDDYTARRLRALLTDLRAARAETFRALNEELTGNLTDMGGIEARHEETLIEEAVPIVLKLATIDIRKIGAIVRDNPFEGQILSRWFATLSAQDQERLQREVTIGIVNGETNEQVIQRVIGTRRNNFNDGVLSISRRNAEAIVRTAANHVSNAARQTVWDANSDIISGERWTSVLDGRTTPICRARDGQVFPIGVGPRPPAHFNCRSIMVAVLDGVGIVGERPYVTDTRRREKREVDFRELAQQEAGEAWRSMSAQERRQAVAQVRRDWAARNIGQVPAATTYQDWLTKQSATFQDQVLGKRRGLLFRKGGLTVQQFVDRAGQELSLKELKDLYPSAWQRALG